jgi:hypothetical protein
MNKQFFAAVLLLSSSFSAFAADDAVHLQWSICDTSPELVLQKLGQNPKSPDKEEQITYYETNPPVYTQQGLSFRTKAKKGKFKSEVKVRFEANPGNLQDGLECSWDRYGSKTTYSCALAETNVDSDTLWTDAEKSFVNRYHVVDFTSLVAFGPFDNPKWNISVDGVDGVFDTVDANSQHLMEVEVETTQSQAGALYDKVNASLLAHGVKLCEVQEGKTARLLHSLGLLPAGIAF